MSGGAAKLRDVRKLADSRAVFELDFPLLQLPGLPAEFTSGAGSVRAQLSFGREQGYAMGNADVTVICEAPKVGPHAQAMREAVAGELGCEINRISIKATTTEKLGFTGRGEGIAAQACVLLVLA